jgi:hypothetical protein
MLNYEGSSSTWSNRSHVKAHYAATIRLMSDHGAQLGSNECWFLWREENRRTRRKTLEAREKINKKLDTHMTPSLGIEPGSQWWEASARTTTPPMLPFSLCAFVHTFIHVVFMIDRFCSTWPISITLTRCLMKHSIPIKLLSRTRCLAMQVS